MNTSQVAAVVMFGGGIDSAALIELECRNRKLNALLLYVDYGAKAAMGEIASLRYFANKYGFPYYIASLGRVFAHNPIIDTALTDDHQNDYVPGRNLLIASIAFSLACRYGAQEVLFGAQPLPPNDNMLAWALDMQQGFIGGFNDLTARCYPNAKRRPWVHAALLKYPDKETYVRATFKREPRLFEAGVTTSCYQSETMTPCGRCAHCIARDELRRKVGG